MTEPDEFDRLALDTLAKVRRMSDELREFCDSVVIIATICEGDSSQMIHQKRGNIYAVRGSVDRFNEILDIEQVRRDAEPPDNV